MKGWYGNTKKHSLASRGISTKDMKDIIQYPEVIEYKNASEIIVGFWISNINNDYSKFNFDKAFGVIKNQLNDYVNVFGIDKEVLEKIYDNEYDEDEIYDLQNEYGFGSELIEVMEYIHKINYRDPNNLKGNISLLDNIIHLEHMNGGMLWDEETNDWLYVDSLREDFGKTMKRLGVKYNERLVW